ncbi:hypothetical protein CRENBAI_022081 [Crenichthys baileyi]|uniref:Epiplakin n=1 Tax=Crenichthys baileyi TaxID=28760 RepID=A0AAV9QPF0_9TELE
MSELKVFYNPSTQENLNYQNLLETCTVEPHTGLLLLPVYIAFKGLRKGISSSELFESKIIDKETYEDLQKGKTTTQDVMLMETVKEYLEGKGSIAGIVDLSTNQIMSIYQAMKQWILMPGTALILLEAQAATGFIIDPVENKKYTVDEAIKHKLIGPECHLKLLSAEQAVTGYKDPYSGGTVSLFQAMSKDLIVKEHGIRLLEAQIATGGIIDPINSHRLPTQVAFKRGYFDAEMKKILEDEGDDTKGFFDPNTEENLTYLQLIERCVTDPGTGLCLLPLHDKSGKLNSIFIDYKTKTVFKAEKVKVKFGKYMGMTVSLWELLMSEYFNEHQRKEMFLKYREGKLNIDTIIKMVLETIETSVKTTKMVFEGIREPVTAKQLVEADIISEDMLEDLEKGKKSVKEIIEDENVNVYLQGKDGIAGILLPDSQIMTIYQARQKAKLMPGTALILLEAQAATGFIIDPIGNRKFSVDDAVKAKIVGPDVCQKLRSAERAVTGYKDPHDGKIISLFQAMQKDLILRDHGIRLLEAQIATGGIIDPVNSHRIPVHVAYKRGYFNEEMNQILSDPSDDTKGFFDPDTHENLTYLELMAKCVKDPSTGLHLLPLKSKGSKINIDDNMRELFQRTTINVKYGRFKGSKTLWEAINSEYLSEDRRQEFFKNFRSRKITIEQLTVIILEIIESKEIKQQPELNFKCIRGEVSVVDLLDLKIVDDKTYNNLIAGKVSSTDVMKMEGVRAYLEGTSCVAGLILQPSNQKLSIYEGQKTGILTPGTALCLLEAQAATGFIVDPLKKQKLTVEEALREKVIGPQMYEKLLSAERAVTGYEDPYTGQKISLFQALKNDLIVKQHGIRLLEAQIATGGIIDPLKCLHLPLEVAYRKAQSATGWLIDPVNHRFCSVDEAAKEKVIGPDVHEQLLSAERAVTGFKDPYTDVTISLFEAMKKRLIERSEGLCLLDAQIATGGIIDPNQSHRLPPHIAIKKGYLDEETHKILLNPTDDTKGFYDPNTNENLSYLQLMNRCERDSKTGLLLLSLHKEESKVFHTGEQVELAFKNKRISLDVGKFKNKQVTVWELLLSEYISKEKREQLIKQYKTGALKLEEITEILTVIITELSSKERKFKGLRKQVSASELFESKIISKELFGQIIQGSVREENVTKIESIQKYLGATNCIAGVRVESTKMVMSIYEAKSRGLLTPGTSLVLLEAQAATGFVIDPVNNKKLSVDEAVAQGVVGKEWKEKLLSAERAVTGYKDPYTGNTISLFQALKKDLVVKDHGIRLLEAQIATGGIIDPVHSHRVPVQVAYQRGYFDEEMNQILSDPDDDTKGFFDPNTNENLTYLQLIERCTKDPLTDLNLLSIVKKGEFYFVVDEATKLILKSTTTTKAGGKYKATTVSLWDLLYSKYITEEKGERPLCNSSKLEHSPSNTSWK